MKDADADRRRGSRQQMFGLLGDCCNDTLDADQTTELDRMLLTDPARAEMTKVLRISASPEAGAQTWSVAIPGTIADPPTLVRVLPLEDCSYVFTGASALLVPTALERQKAPNQQLLVTMFGLTRAEARVGSLLAAGIPAKVIAQLQGVTTHTIRMQLKSVYRKLGVRRQAEVINMLARSPS